MGKTSAGPRPGIRPALLLAGLLLGAGALAQSQPTLYRWVDKDGHVHYDDSGTAPGAKPVNPHALSGGEDAGAGATDSKAAAARQAECKARGDDYNRYKTGGSVTETDALGNTRIYTPEEKDRLVERKRQELVALCGAAAAEPPPAAAAATPQP